MEDEGVDRIDKVYVVDRISVALESVLLCLYFGAGVNELDRYSTFNRGCRITCETHHGKERHSISWYATGIDHDRREAHLAHLSYTPALLSYISSYYLLSVLVCPFSGYHICETND